MKTKLQKISINETGKNLIKDVEVIKEIKKTKEPIYVLIEPKISEKLEKNTNQLLEIEIALRKCDRFGFFSK